MRITTGVFLLLVTRATCQADVSGELALLDRISAENVANRARIETWEGLARVTDSIRDQHTSGRFERVSEVSFALDRPQERHRFFWHCLATKRFRDDGTVIEDEFAGGRIGGMVQGGLEYSYAPWTPDGHVIQSVHVDSLERRRIGPMTDHFQPMFFFLVRDEYEVDEKLAHYRDLAEESWCVITVSRESAIVSVDFFNKNLPDVLTTFWFNLEQAGNLVRAVVTAPEREEEWTRTYEQQAGIWVPLSATYRNRTTSGDEESWRTTEIVRQTLNATLADDAFSLESMGVLPGARITDSRTMQTAMFGEARQQPPAKAPVLSEIVQPAEPAEVSSAWLLIGGNVLVFGVIAVVFYWSRKRSTPYGGN